MNIFSCFKRKKKYDKNLKSRKELIMMFMFMNKNNKIIPDHNT